MIALFFLAGSFLMGIAAVSRFLPDSSRLERVLWGPSLGSMASIWISYIIARYLHSISFAVLVLLGIAMWSIAGILFYLDREKWPAITRRLVCSRDHLLLALLIVLFGWIFCYVFYTGMFHPKENGLYLTATSWYDMPYHLALADSFLYGRNFPPLYPVFPSELLRYPFLPDFYAGMLMKLGLGTWPTFAITSFVAAMILVAAVYQFGRRLTDSNLAAFFSTLLFFFNGGLGFLLFFKDWRNSHLALVDFFFNMKENYTDIWPRGIRWQNLIISGLIPRRTLLLGMPIAFIVLTLLVIVWRSWSSEEKTPTVNQNRNLLAAGLITGLLPLFDLHTYFAMAFITFFLSLLRPRLIWLRFWLPALLLAAPQLFNLRTHVTSHGFIHFYPGWVSYIDSNFIHFIFWNFGLPLLLIAPAFFFVSKSMRLFFLPFLALMIFCFLFITSPNDTDNIKLMYYAYAGAVVVISAWMAKLIVRYRKLQSIVGLAVLACIASGVLSIVKVAVMSWRIFSPEEIEVGTFARTLPAKSLFLTGQNHNQPVLCFAGKSIVLGYDFWIVSHGYERSRYDAVLRDLKKMYAGGPQAEALLQKYGVKYVYIGPPERTELHANSGYFDTHHAVVFRNKEMTIYEARAL